MNESETLRNPNLPDEVELLAIHTKAIMGVVKVNPEADVSIKAITQINTLREFLDFAESFCSDEIEVSILRSKKCNDILIKPCAADLPRIGYKSPTLLLAGKMDDGEHSP